MNEKEAILRDLKVIAILDEKIDYSDKDNIGAVLKLNPRSLFATEYGSRYLHRIRKMHDDLPYDRTCILCGAPLDGDGPICSSCYKVITIGNSVIPERPEPVHTDHRAAADEAAAKTSPEASKEAFQQEASEIYDHTADDTEEALSGQTGTDAVSGEAVTSPETDALSDGAKTAAWSGTDSQETEAFSKTEAETSQESGSEAETSQESGSETEISPDVTDEQTISAEEGFTEDASEVRRTYDEIEQDMNDPAVRFINALRALVMLLVVVCFSIGIVCGLVLMIRRAGRASTGSSAIIQTCNSTVIEQTSGDGYIDIADAAMWKDHFSL